MKKVCVGASSREVAKKQLWLWEEDAKEEEFGGKMRGGSYTPKPVQKWSVMQCKLWQVSDQC